MPVVTETAIIQHFNLTPHPEGGYYRETYRSAENILPAHIQGSRSVSTAIYFLLPQGAKSHLHRIASDEMWHFYLGGPMTLVLLHPGGQVETILLGPDILGGQVVQAMVPGGVWFGGIPTLATDYAFVGCTVAPGFDFADFELGDRQTLLTQYPQAQAWIEQLTPDP